MRVWFSPPNDPTAADTRIKKVVVLDDEKYDIKTNGAIFCQIKTMAQCIQGSLIIIWGNQKWNGAIPALVAIAIKITGFIIELKFIAMLRGSAEAKKIKNTEAIACTRKYLMAASVVELFRLLKIKGINLIKLISSPSQQVNQELAETAITVPSTKKIKKVIW